MAWTRRETLAAAALAPAAGLAAPAARGAGSARPRSAELVHGAWHGGWCWRDVAAMLQSHGWSVFAPDLTGLGGRAHLMGPDIGLDTHIDDIAGLIESRELEHPVVVGHSYAGMVVTGVADRLRDRLGPLVYLDANLPADGDNFFTQNPAFEGRPDLVEREIAQARRLAPDGIAMAPLPAAVFGVPPDTQEADWVNRRLTPHPLKTWLDPIRLRNGGSDGLERIYVHCTEPVLEPSSIPHHAARVREDPSWRYLELPTGHDAMVTRPDLVAQLIGALG